MHAIVSCWIYSTGSLSNWTSYSPFVLQKQGHCSSGFTTRQFGRKSDHERAFGDGWRPTALRKKTAPKRLKQHVMELLLEYAQEVYDKRRRIGKSYNSFTYQCLSWTILLTIAFCLTPAILRQLVLSNALFISDIFPDRQPVC